MDAKRLRSIAIRTGKLYVDCGMPVCSGNATLFIITAIFPLLMLVISIVNLLPGYSPENVSEIFFRLLPNLDAIRELVESMITNLRDQSGGLLASIAALTTLWSASGGVNAIRIGLDQLERGAKGRPLHSALLKRLLFTVLVVVLIPAFLLFNMLGGAMQRMLDSIIEKLGAEILLQWRDALSSAVQVGTLLVPIAALFTVLLVYAYLPAKHRKLKHCLPGTLFTGVSCYLFTQVFAYAIPRFYRASSLYGSLASLFLALLWIRIILMILFAGGALNKAIEDDAKQRSMQDGAECGII